MALTFGSLFAGIGGIDLGLERAGMRCAWQVEIDEYCRSILAKHWPDAAQHKDVREVGAHNLEPVDLICGGFPCQDVSLAGKRAGLDGKRTTLWGEMHRIICEIRPRWVLAENVPGLLSSDNGRFFGNILGDLADSGYDVEWNRVSASSVGAPHRRDRIFIVAYHNGEREPQSGWLFREVGGWAGNGGAPAAPADPGGDWDDEFENNYWLTPIVADAEGEYGERPVASGDRGGQSKAPSRDGSGDSVGNTHRTGCEEQRWAEPTQSEQRSVERTGGGAS